MKLETITAANFAPFGTVLELDPAGENPVFQIPVRVSDAPWRLALLKILPREITQLERHCTSRESFEPLSGCAAMPRGERARCRSRNRGACVAP